MTLAARDYTLFITPGYTQAYDAARANLARRGVLDLFERGVNTLLGQISQGVLSFPGARQPQAGVVSVTIQNVILHLRIDPRRGEIRIIRLLDRSPPF